MAMVIEFNDPRAWLLKTETVPSKKSDVMDAKLGLATNGGSDVVLRMIRKEGVVLVLKFVWTGRSGESLTSGPTRTVSGRIYGDAGM